MSSSYNVSNMFYLIGYLKYLLYLAHKCIQYVLFNSLSKISFISSSSNISNTFYLNSLNTLIIFNGFKCIFKANLFFLANTTNSDEV